MLWSVAGILAEADRASARGESCLGEALGRRALRAASEAGMDPKVVRNKLADMYKRRPAFDSSLPERARGRRHRVVEAACDCALMQPEPGSLAYRASSPMSVSLLLLVPAPMWADHEDPLRVIAPFVEAIFANANLFMAAKQPGDLSYVGVRSFTARERPIPELLRDRAWENAEGPVFLPSTWFVIDTGVFWPVDAEMLTELAEGPTP